MTAPDARPVDAGADERRVLSGADRRRGAVLLMVLVLAAAASSLAVVAMRSSATAARAASVYLDEVRTEQLGRAATDLIAARLQGTEPQVRRAGAFRARFADAEVEVNYVSENARVDLNAAPPELLAALFQAVGVRPTEARALADRVVDWRDADAVKRPSGAELEDYARAGRPGPGNRPFSHVAELAQVLDVPAGVRDAVLPFVTVASGQAGVDPTLAGRPVVKALMGGDERRTDLFVAARAAGFESRQAILGAFPTASQAFVGLEPGRAVRASIRVVARGRFERRYEAVVGAAEGGLDVPVIAWGDAP